MSHERYVKRTLWIAQCDCGERTERADNAPRERLCACGKWVPYVEQSYIGPELPGGRPGERPAP